MPKSTLSSSSPSKWGQTASSVKVPSTMQRNERALSNMLDHEQHHAQIKIFEDELMGHKEGEGQIGDSIERNMNQMVDVLRSKINAMGNAAKTRIRLCEEDLKKNSKESSDQVTILRSLIRIFDTGIVKFVTLLQLIFVSYLLHTVCCCIFLVC